MKMREGQRDEYTKGQSGLPVARASPSGLGLRIEDSPCQASFLSAALIALLCLFVCPSPAQTTKATEQADQVTQDLLKEIGTAPTSQAAAAPSAERLRHRRAWYTRKLVANHVLRRVFEYRLREALSLQRQQAHR